MFSRECIGILILSAILRSPDLFPNYHIRIGRAVYFAMGSTDEWARGSGGRRGRENCEISEIRHLDHVHEAGRMAATNRQCSQPSGVPVGPGRRTAKAPGRDGTARCTCARQEVPEN